MFKCEGNHYIPLKQYCYYLFLILMFLFLVFSIIGYKYIYFRNYLVTLSLSIYLIRLT